MDKKNYYTSIVIQQANTVKQKKDWFLKNN